jgi:hypothetical protein
VSPWIAGHKGVERHVEGVGHREPSVRGSEQRGVGKCSTDADFPLFMFAPWPSTCYIEGHYSAPHDASIDTIMHTIPA